MGCTPIEDVEIPLKTRAHMATLVEALQYIYTHPQWNERIFNLLSDKIIKGKKQTGRSGDEFLGDICTGSGTDLFEHLL